MRLIKLRYICIIILAGVELWKLFTGFPQAAQHLVYAILSGRPVVLAGFAHQQDLVLSLCRALGPLLPPTGTARKQPQVLRLVTHFLYVIDISVLLRQNLALLLYYQ
jgi:hypothetical protein